MDKLPLDDAGSEPSGYGIQLDFNKLYEDYQEAIEQYLVTWVHNKEQAEDFCQETFKRALDYFSRQGANLPQTDYHIKNWLYRTAKNLVIDEYRHNKSIDFLPMPDSETYIQIDALVVEGDEDRICEQYYVEEVLAAMSPQYQTCLRLVESGYTQREVATLLGINEKTVSSNVRRGYKQFRMIYTMIRIGRVYMEMCYIEISGPDFSEGLLPRLQQLLKEEDHHSKQEPPQDATLS